MKSPRHVSSPDTRRSAEASLRFLTRLAVVVATGATVVVGIVVAKEHPGSSASVSSPSQSPSTSTTVAPTTSTTPSTTSPTSSDLGAGSSSHDDDHLIANHDDHRATYYHDHSTGYDVRRHTAMSASLLARPDAVTTERSFRALGTTASVVVTVGAKADEAEAILRSEVEAVDLACSRFRPDSELASFHAKLDGPSRCLHSFSRHWMSRTRVAERTHGAVDPTVGSAIVALGYDRHFEEIESRPLRLTDLGPVPGFRHLHLDHARRTARIPEGRSP